MPVAQNRGMDTYAPPEVNRPYGELAGGPDIRFARTITRWLDRLYIDPILGLLVPGAGDLVSGATGAYLVMLALRNGAPKVVVARMLINLTVDTVVGSIPLIGDLFDFAFKANQKNLALLERTAEAPRTSSPGDWAYVIGAGALFLAALVLPIVLLVWFLGKIF